VQQKIAAPGICLEQFVGRILSHYVDDFAATYQKHNQRRLITYIVVELKIHRPAYRIDFTTQSPVSNFQNDIGVE
jgi:hypothetical protein